MIHIRRVHYGNLGWRGRLGIVVGVAVVLAAAMALAIVALGLTLILLPIVAVGLAIARWRFRGLMRRDAGPPDESGRPIEIEYTVVEGRDRR